MLDRESGTIKFDEPARSISRGLTRSAFLSSPLCSGAKMLIKNEPYCTWKLGGEYRSAISFVITLCFHDERLIRVDLTHVDPRYGTSWSDWSDEKEAQRKAEHDRWLKGHLGSKRTFGWGKVSSDYDPRAGASSISIAFSP